MEIKRKKTMQYNITWEILKKAKPYSATTNKCNLYLFEKYHIITANKTTTLNSRNELFSKCRHKKHIILSEFG